MCFKFTVIPLLKSYGRAGTKMNCSCGYLSVVSHPLVSLQGDSDEWGRWTAAMKWIGDGSNSVGNGTTEYSGVGGKTVEWGRGA